MKKTKKLAWIGLIIYTIALSLLLLNSSNDTFERADYAIVYGNTVNPDGSLSDRLKARLDASIELYNNSTVTGILVSGAVGKEGHDEAIVMQQYLVQNSISEIIVDSQGYTTNLTSINSKALLKEGASVVAVTQYFHTPRANLSLENAGFKQVYRYSPDYYEVRDFYSVNRELVAYLKYWLMAL
ncbi:MAG: YdcF family protein [Gammaproteobacteria bacterium]|nr:YdcF family protein [Gammaproteobacteria bacterium]